MIPIFIIFGILALGALVAALHEAYAAGWNASARYHRNRDRMDPFWVEYR